MFYYGDVSLKRLFFWQNFSVWDISIYLAFYNWLFDSLDKIESSLLFALEFLKNPKLVNHNNCDLLESGNNNDNLEQQLRDLELIRSIAYFGWADTPIIGLVTAD